MRLKLLVPLLLLLTSCHIVDEPTLQSSDQREITYHTQMPAPGLEIKDVGWAKSPIWEYSPENIPEEFSKQKKEWEHYTIIGKNYSMSITLMNVGFLAAALVDFVHFDKKFDRGNVFFSFADLQNFTFPENPFGETRWESDGDFVSFKYEDGERFIEFAFKNKIVMAPFSGKLKLTDPPESIAVVRPFDKPKQFFYENKVFAMHAEGEIKVEGETYPFEPQTDSAILDWGRGVWPQHGGWYWGYFKGVVDGKEIAINMSYGYGDDNGGTVNALLVDGKIQKLDKIIARGDIKKPEEGIKIISNDGRINLRFKPLYHQKVNLDVVIYYAKLDKLYGTFTGDIVLDDGSKVKIKDFKGFAENVFYKW